MKTLLSLAAMAVALPFAAFAHDGEVGIHDGYARASNPKSGAAFMLLHNGTDEECTLVGVISDVAEKTELHTHKDENGVMRMLSADPIVMPARSQHELVRGGDHIMMMGLKAPLENGQDIALQLDFGDCGKLDVTVPVDNDRQPGAAAANAEHDEHAGH